MWRMGDFIRGQLASIKAQLRHAEKNILRPDFRHSTFIARNSMVRISRFSSKKFPGAPERMRFGIEDDFAEIQSLGRGEEEVKIFECLGQDEALHFIALLLGHDI